MLKLTKWQDAAALPVVQEPRRWSLRALEGVLTDSIRRCSKIALERDGAILTLLSGGLDSSFCLAKIREIHGNGVKIFTLTLGGHARHSDIVHARMVAKKFKAISVEKVPTATEIAAAESTMEALWPQEVILPGDVATFLALKFVQVLDFQCVLSHDGIDELLGGYPEHRWLPEGKKRKEVFNDFWQRLVPEHLLPFEKKAGHFGVQVIWPYLQRPVVEYISRILPNERTGEKESKIPLRAIARKYLPREIIERQKLGFCDALTETVNQAP